MGFFTSLFGAGETTAAELARQIAAGAFLVDVRSRGEFESGSVKGAVNIPLDLLTQQIDKFRNKEHIVVFCRSGNRSGQAKRLLNEQGFKNVTNGGTWQQVSQIVNSNK